MNADERQARKKMIREAYGLELSVEASLKRAAAVLARFGIPHLVCGGMAVQEHGYARFTSDGDVIVPDVAEARDRLSMNGFRENHGSSMTVTDRVNGIEINLLPGGGSVGPGPVKLPMPTVVSKEPSYLSLEDLISVKLSSWIGCGSGDKRLKDRSDVGELIGANDLPRDFRVDLRVKSLYEEIWDNLKGESDGKR